MATCGDRMLETRTARISPATRMGPAVPLMGLLSDGGISPLTSARAIGVGDGIHAHNAAIPRTAITRTTIERASRGTSCINLGRSRSPKSLRISKLFLQMWGCLRFHRLDKRPGVHEIDVPDNLAVAELGRVDANAGRLPGRRITAERGDRVARLEEHGHLQGRIGILGGDAQKKPMAWSLPVSQRELRTPTRPPGTHAKKPKAAHMDCTVE